jgi:tetratricopeptide (TPR) repeat protein
MRFLLVFGMVILMGVGALMAQTSEKYSGKYSEYFRGEELFEKAQFTAARRIFRKFLDGFNDVNDPLYIKARYYEGIAALELYNNDAIGLLMSFNQDYPENIHKNEIYFKIGTIHYHGKKYKDAIEWLEKTSPLDIDTTDLPEYYFKLGYSYFQMSNYAAARDNFYEIKEGNSQYAIPALYYFSHIAYMNKTYQVALDGFLRIADDESFKEEAPYYVTQIYHLQQKYENLVLFAPKFADIVKPSYQPTMHQLIGDAYFQLRRFDEAAFHLAEFHKRGKPSKEDIYQLGYAYYKSNNCRKAIEQFGRISKSKDRLSQVAYYHAAECYLKLEEANSARAAFKEAALIDDDPEIQEDALYNYAVLSYELDYNPYNDAKRAFEDFLIKFPKSKRREDVYAYLVNVYLTSNQYQEALDALDQIGKLDINQKSAYQLIAFNMGVDYLEQNKPLKAITSLDKVKKYPIDAAVVGKAIFWQGEAHYRLKNYNEAIRKFREFVSIPGSMGTGFKELAYYNIAYIYFEQEDYTQAIEAFRTFTQLPNNEDNKRLADAFMRIGDAYYTRQNPDFPAASLNYKKAVDLKETNQDRALFYLAKTYGFQFDKQNEKISTLLQLVNNYRNSAYTVPSIFEVGLTYKNSNKLDQAIRYFDQIVKDYPRNILVKSALIEIADIKFKLKDYQAGESYAKRALNEFTLNDEQCQQAVNILKDIYLANRQPEKIGALAQEYACAKITEDDQEEYFYVAANQLYINEKFNEAIPEIKKYLAAYPNGRFSIQLKSYLADIYFQRDEKGQALIYYEQIIQEPDNAYTEEALIRASKTLYNEGKYADALPYYSRLKDLASTPQVVYNTSVGLMRCNFLLQFYPNAYQSAFEVLQHNLFDERHKLEANYVAGFALFRVENFREAKSYLRWTADNTGEVRGTEALHYLAEAHYRMDELPEAEKIHNELMRRKPSYDYWIARSLILQAQVYMKVPDFLQAESTINLVLRNYPIEDDGVLDEANKVYSELMQLKENPRGGEEDLDRIIDIEDE